MNIERIRRIAAIELATPDSFDMISWETPGACGTTRCIAGWAIYDEIGGPIWDTNDEFTPAFLDFMRGADPTWEARTTEFPVEVAGDLLGLTEEQYMALFFTYTAQGRTFLEQVRSGASEAELADWVARLTVYGS